jgi:hypothetical protein
MGQVVSAAAAGLVLGPHCARAREDLAEAGLGRTGQVRQARAEVLSAAYARKPERFVRKHPEPPTIPTTVSINESPPEDTTTAA